MIRKSVLELVGEGQPEADTILAPDHAPLSRGGLFGLVLDTVRQLRDLGLWPEDPVAVVHHDGAQMAAVFLGGQRGCGSSAAQSRL